jgi:PAS domain S-box-containing protein
MVSADQFLFLSGRIRKWLPYSGEKDSAFGWFIVPLLLTSMAIAVLIALFRANGSSHTYVTLYPAVIISTLLGGYRAGLVALFLTASGAIWLFDPNTTPDAIGVAAFVLDCLLIIIICHTMAIAARHAADARAETRHALQLLKSEQLFRVFIEHAPAALAMFDKDMRYIGASRRWMNDYGINDDSIQGMSYPDNSPDMPSDWTEARFKALDGEISRKAEDRIVHPDGREQWLRWEVRPWTDFSGAVAGIVIFSEDITLQKHAAEAIAESEVRARAIIESVQDAMIVTDSEGNIESFNSAAIGLFGYSASELLESNIERLVGEPRSGGDKPGPSGEGASSGAGEEFADGGTEVEGTRKGGASFPADHMANEWSDIYGDKHRTVIVRDISERRASEEELAWAGKMEAVGRLAGGIAHDFNNLLSIIAGNLELAEPQISHAKARTMIQKALMAAERGAGFTQQLLTLARKRQTEFQEVDFNQHVSSNSILLEHTLGSNVRMRISLAPDLWITRADPIEVDSAIINLAMNAGDAMPNGGTLYISTSNATIDRKRRGAGASEPAGEFVRITVRDSGSGMTREVRRHAFEPFFTTKEQGAGTGLGLPSVYSFAQAAGGFVTLDSSPGKGTTVELYIPRFVGGERRSGTRAVGGRRKRGHGEIILVVEDDQEVREVSVERLERLGYATRSAASVSEACQILREEQRIALVFSDIVLTGARNGYDLARWVERNRPDVNVLLTTGYDVGDKQLCRDEANPPVRRLEKPHTMTQLADEIRKALEIEPPEGA